MQWSGRVQYVTGGTTRTPRLIKYDAARWSQSIRIKARLLSEYGVDGNARVAVCHPFAPWAIGSVFTEASLYCGAYVFPIGLVANRAPFQDMLFDFNPTHICGTCRNLIRWANELAQRGKCIPRELRRVAFVAGEPITPIARHNCSARWSAKVINIYGLAEFDMIGVEHWGGHGFSLVPEFEYGIIDERTGEIVPILVGCIGELCIHEPRNENWHRTGDRVRVAERTESPGGTSWNVHFLGRINETAVFADGSLLTVEHLNRVRERCPEIAVIQVQVRHADEGDSVSILCVVKEEPDSDFAERVKEALLASNIDLADGFGHGVIRTVDVRIVSDAELFLTPRGKAPSIVEIDSGY
jgi:phenylacetate-coenzyme A ligase PaaK-like adenylate-forming protein